MLIKFSHVVMIVINTLFCGLVVGNYVGKLDYENNQKHWDKGFEFGTQTSLSQSQEIENCKKNGEKIGLEMYPMIIFTIKNNEEIRWCIRKSTGEMLQKIMNERRVH